MSAATVAGVSRAEEIPRLQRDMMTAVYRYRQAKRVFAEVTAAYVDKLGPGVEAEYQARVNDQRVCSIADAAFYRDEAAMCAVVLLALRAGDGP